MEKRGHESPTPIHIEQPLQEHRVGREVWHPHDFHERLVSPHEIVYHELPQEIHLGENWHGLMRRLVAATTEQRREYSVTMSCIDQHGPLWSKPFEIDLFFQEQWGDSNAPIFISNVIAGTESHTESCVTPSAIEWAGAIVPLWRVGGIHTHPSGVPFSEGDMLWLTNPNTRKKFEAVATESTTYLLVRSDAEPRDAHHYIQMRENRFTWPQWLRYQLRPKQTILARNMKLAQYCMFGLYQGRTSEPLMRIA